MQEHIFDILKNRIEQIRNELNGDDAWNAYFAEVAGFVTDVIDAAEKISDGSFASMSGEDKKKIHDRLYAHITDGYESSFLNPDVAVAAFGTDNGRILSAIYAELTSMISRAYEADEDGLTVSMALFLELYGTYTAAVAEGIWPDTAALKPVLADYAYDESQYMTDRAADELYGRDNGVAGRIIESADLGDTAYLYDYGEYISDNEIRMAGYAATLSDTEIADMASVFVQGYIKGFEVTGKDISIKDLVEVRYFVGFERVVREAVKQFNEAGLDVSLRRSESSFAAGRKLNKIGYYSTIPNRQFEADHENDKSLYYDKRFLEHRLMCYRNSLERNKAATNGYGGPAVIESFGISPVRLKDKDSVIKPDEKMNELFSQYSVRALQILNEYVKGDERSFTIISFPIPAIGDRFKDIFKETIRLNTLDYELYRDMQQIIIDELDKADHVRIEGCNGNRTDLKVNLWKLKDPDKETIFENCVADVNIPVGEVFTSPVLEGTEGVLHVNDVYLNEMPFTDLELKFKDGMIESYSCGNYDNEQACRDYIMKYLLFSHKTLPIGEFAIGTNTTAYTMTKRYGLESVMPILIAEKTGPHFAVGDTCYSHEEDMVTYNPDGKAIVARENSVSKKRKDKPLEAYFGCHTDITIPYDELGRLYAVTSSGDQIDIIRDGRFVLKGTEKLNEALEER